MMNKKKILLVDDDECLREEFCDELNKKYDVIEAEGYHSAVSAYRENSVDLTILDINFPNEGKNGIDVLKEIKQIDRFAPVIMFSVNDEINTAVECIRLGAYDYLEKKASISVYQELLIKIEECFKRESEKRFLENIVYQKQQEYPLVYRSKQMTMVVEKIKTIENTRFLIVGESGVGKSLIAYHSNQYLSKNGVPRPFVEENCAALRPDTIQDVLFGHIRGAYTGSVSDKPQNSQAS
jgi:DNA-binding NtrC family response regulator